MFEPNIANKLSPCWALIRFRSVPNRQYTATRPPPGSPATLLRILQNRLPWQLQTSPWAIRRLFKKVGLLFFLTCWMSSWTFWVDSGLTYGKMFAFPPNTARPSHVSVFARQSFCMPRRKWSSLPAFAWISSLHHVNMWHIFFVNTLTCLPLSLKRFRETLRCCLVAQAAMT